MGRKLILAEKPAVARDLARVLGVPQSGGGGAFESADWVITWCIGHLIELEEPAAYRPEWQRWSLDLLPMLPQEFLLRPVKDTLKQWRVVRDHLRDRGFTAVINACDAGREGELIFQLCYQLAGSRLPVERLWISSLTDQAIAAGMGRLRPGADLLPLAAAARCRSEADWLVGMNATRAVTLQRRAVQDVLCSIGRVQTPTLGILVNREREIQRFVPRDYYEVHADLETLGGKEGPEGDQGGRRFKARWHFLKATRLGVLAEATEIRDRSTAAAQRGQGPVVESLEQKTVREPPPLLFDLTALQRTANRRFGFSAQQTLQVAQALYEKHKIITYPRTDSRYLTSDVHGQLGRIFAGLAQEPVYQPLVAPLSAQLPPPLRRVFQDGKARDHHAIIPTPVALTGARMAALSREERDLFDLIARRFIGAFYPDAEFLQTVVEVRVGPPAPPPVEVKEKKKTDEAPSEPPMLEQAPPPPDRYQARGRVRVVAGWQVVAGYGAREAPAAREQEADDDQQLPPLAEGQPLRGRFQIEARQTQPPPRYSEATLLSAMESAGRQISDPELREEMKELGLGTPATRAAIIETLLTRKYIERQGKILHPTALGLALIETLPVPELASAELTGRWEARLAKISRGEDSRQAFMADIAQYVERIVALVRAAPPPAAVPGLPPAKPRGEWGTKRTRSATGKTTGKTTTRTTRTGKTTSKTARTRTAAAGAEAKPRTRAARTTVEEPTRTRAPRGTVEEPTRTRAARASAGEPLAHTRSALAAATTAGVGQALVPPLSCPRCREGQLLVGRRGWGCSRWAAGCPLVIPFEILGHRLRDGELRALVADGATPPLSFRPSGTPVSGRLRLAPGGSPAGFVYLEEPG